MKHLPELDGTIVANYQFHMEKLHLINRLGRSSYQVIVELQINIGRHKFYHKLCNMLTYESIEDPTESEDLYLEKMTTLFLDRLDLILRGYIQKDKVVEAFKKVYYSKHSRKYDLRRTDDHEEYVTRY